MITSQDIQTLDRAYRTRDAELRALTETFLAKLKMYWVTHRYRNRNLFQVVGYNCRGLPGSTFRGSRREHYRTFREMVAGVLEHARNLLDEPWHPWVLRSGHFISAYSASLGEIQVTPKAEGAVSMPRQHAAFLARAFKTTLYPFVCMDCGGKLVHQQFSHFGKPYYACERRPACRGLCSAHPKGRPLGFPVNAETRRARKLTHQKFDLIWESAPDEYGEDGWRNPRKFQRIGRYRCYAYIAHCMNMPKEQCHIGQLTIEELRVFYRHCIGLTYATVRAWYKANKAERDARENRDQHRSKDHH